MNAGVTVNYVVNSKNEKDKLKVLKDSLSLLKIDKKDDQCGVSANIITKIAKAGINMDDLKKTYQEKGLNGLQILLSQSINQKPRVTARKQIIAAIKKKLDKLINGD